MSKLLVNLGNVPYSDTAVFNKVAREDTFTPYMSYFDYISNATSSARTRQIDFAEAGTLQGVIIGIYMHYTHFEDPNDLIRFDALLQEDVSGTWTTRATGSFLNTDYMTPGTKRTVRDYAYVAFDTPYAVDTTSGKWRFRFEVHRLGGSDTRRIYMLKQKSASFATAGVVVPVLQETQTLDRTDGALFNFGKLVIDAPTQFDGLDIDYIDYYSKGYRNRRILFLNGLSKLNEEHPKTIFTETAGATRLGGIVGIAAAMDKEDASVYVCQDENNLMSKARQKVRLIFHKSSSSFRGTFDTYIAGRGVTTYRSMRIFSEVADTWRGKMTAPANKGDNSVKIQGDFTSVWQAGDVVYITTPTYASNRAYNDYNHHEKLVIDSMSYDAGTDETTVVFTSNLKYYYDFNIFNNFSHSENNCNINPDDWDRWVINAERDGARCVIQAEGYSHTTNNNNRLESWLYDFVPQFDGVRIEDFKYFRAEQAANKYATANSRNVYFKNAALRFSYMGMYWRYYNGGAAENVQSFLGWIGSTKVRNSRSVSVDYARNWTVKNVFIPGAGYIYFPYGQNIDIDGGFFEGDYLINQVSGTKNYTVRNITVPLSRRFVHLAMGAGDLDIYNLNLLFGAYDSNYTPTSNTYAGIFYASPDSALNGKVNVYDAQVGTILVPFYQSPGASGDVYFENLSSTGNIILQIPTAGDTYKQWGTGSVQAFKNYQGSGKIEGWTTNGYYLAVDDGNGGYDWELSPHDDSFTMDFNKDSIATLAGEPIAVSALVKIEDPDFYAQPHQLPRLKISGLGISDPTAEAYGQATTEWQLIAVRGTPQTPGTFDISLDFQTDSPNNKVLVREIAVMPPKPRDTSGLSLLYRGRSLQTIFREVNTSLDALIAPTALDYGQGTFAELLKDGLSGGSDVNVVSVAGTTVNGPDDLKADVSNLATQATADAIKAKTGNLPSDPAKESSVQAIPTNPVLTTDSRLDHLDADVSSRLAASDYTTPPSTTDIDNALSGSHGSGSWVTADTSALALEATVQVVKSKTDALPADPASQAAVQAVAAQVWAQALEGTLTYEAGLRIMLAVLAGTVSGAGTDIEQFYSQDGQTVRVRSHVDEDGNRSQVEVDGS